MEESPMAGGPCFEQSFFSLLWQDVPDFNAELIEIPLGTLSDDQNGFAYENVDGTYTVFLGDVSFVRDLGGVTGAVDTILRLSNIDGPPTIGTTLTEVNGTYSASHAQDAYLDGGTAFFSYIFDGDDNIGFQTPMTLGSFGESPLIETYAGDDAVDGSIYDDTIMTGAGNDEVHAHRGDDDIFGGRVSIFSTVASATTTSSARGATTLFEANVVLTTSLAGTAPISSMAGWC
jgi:hypothetical protein